MIFDTARVCSVKVKNSKVMPLSSFELADSSVHVVLVDQTAACVVCVPVLCM